MDIFLPRSSPCSFPRSLQGRLLVVIIVSEILTAYRVTYVALDLYSYTIPIPSTDLPSLPSLLAYVMDGMMNE